MSIVQTIASFGAGVVAPTFKLDSVTWGTCAGGWDDHSTFAHTCSADTNYLLVTVSSDGYSRGAVTSVTYNGVTMDPLGNSDVYAGYQRATYWGLASPAIGTHNVIATIASAAWVAAGAYSFEGANALPTGTFAQQVQLSNTTPATINVSSSVGNIVVGLFCGNKNFGQVPTVDPPATLAWTDATTINQAGSYVTASGGTTAVTFGLATGDGWTVAGIPIIGA